MLTTLLLLLLPAETAPASQWLEISAAASRIRIVTDSGEKAGRKAALQLAQFDRTLQKRFAWLKGADEAPLIVFASADEVMVRSMAPDTTDAEKDNKRKRRELPILPSLPHDHRPFASIPVHRSLSSKSALASNRYSSLNR